jgi:hypothetical protein
MNHGCGQRHDKQVPRFSNRRAPAWAGPAGLTLDFTSRKRDSGKEKVKKRSSFALGFSGLYGVVSRKKTDPAVGSSGMMTGQLVPPG